MYKEKTRLYAGLSLWQQTSDYGVYQMGEVYARSW
jgi:hypothetical protein